MMYFVVVSLREYKTPIYKRLNDKIPKVYLAEGFLSGHLSVSFKNCQFSFSMYIYVSKYPCVYRKIDGTVKIKTVLFISFIFLDVHEKYSNELKGGI